MTKPKKRDSAEAIVRDLAGTYELKSENKDEANYPMPPSYAHDQYAIHRFISRARALLRAKRKGGAK